TLRSLAWGGGSAALVRSSAAAVNAAPTVLQQIVINGNAPVTGRTAWLSVVGRDDGGESHLAYTWSVTAAPAGGTATGFGVAGSRILLVRRPQF
ncbi:MAG: hypothetical protein ABSF48_24065, partial [Thermodesulfobacteriota bacterium]